MNFENELFQAQHDDKTGVDLIARTKEPNAIYYHYEPVTGLEVEVTERFASNYAVKLTDTDCEKVIGIKMFPADSKDAAIAYAKQRVDDRS